MISFKSKPTNTNVVMKVTEPNKNQNQLHGQPQQPTPGQNQGGGNQGNGGAPKAAGYSSVSTYQAGPIGKNTYIDACWKPNQATRNSPVTIYALLSNSAINTEVKVFIYQKINNQDIKIDELTGKMINGQVTIDWKAQNPNNDDWNKGYYFFMILGGNASKESTNKLTLG